MFQDLHQHTNPKRIFVVYFLKSYFEVVFAALVHGRNVFTPWLFLEVPSFNFLTVRVVCGARKAAYISARFQANPSMQNNQLKSRPSHVSGRLLTLHLREKTSKKGSRDTIPAYQNIATQQYFSFCISRCQR